MAARIGLAQRDGKSQNPEGTISYCAAISACEKGQEWQPAVGLLSTMAIAKVEANPISSLQCGNPYVAKGTRVAARIGLVQRDGKSQSPEGTISYSAAISACEQGQEWQVALGLLSTMA